MDQMGWRITREQQIRNQKQPAALLCRNAVSVAGHSAAARAFPKVNAAGSSAAAMLALINVTFKRNCIGRNC